MGSKQRHLIAKTGLDWVDPKTGKDVRVEAGEECDHLPEKSLSWLLEQGLVEYAEPEGGAD